MQIIPGQRTNGEHAPEVQVIDEATLRAVSDPWERAKLAAELHLQLQARSVAVLDVRRDAIHELVTKLGAARSSVARFLGLTPTRIGQLVGSRRSVAAGEVADGAPSLATATGGVR